MTDPSEQPVSVVSRREAMAGTGVALGSLVASESLTETVMAQSGGPSDEISGIVEDESGAVQGATVVAVPHDTSLAALETTTDASGAYIFEQSDLHEDSNLYHVIARDGTESDPRRGVPNYPFIAAEGDLTIHNSAIHRYDATAISGLSDGDTVTTWENQIGSAGATAGTAPTYQTGVINGNPVVRFDGVDDYLTAAIGTETQPTTFIAVYQLTTVDTDGSSPNALADAGTGESFHFFRQRANEYQHFAGNGLNGGSPTTNPEIQILVFDGASSLARVNGSQISSGDIGTNGLVDLTLGRRANQDQYWDGDIGEFIIYNERLSSGDIQDEEQRLSDKWGIAI